MGIPIRAIIIGVILVVGLVSVGDIVTNLIPALILFLALFLLTSPRTLKSISHGFWKWNKKDKERVRQHRQRENELRKIKEESYHWHIGQQESEEDYEDEESDPFGINGRRRRFF